MAFGAQGVLRHRLPVRHLAQGQVRVALAGLCVARARRHHHGAVLRPARLPLSVRTLAPPAGFEYNHLHERRDAFLANPTRGAVDLVWDALRDPRLTGYEVRWRQARTAGWQSQSIPPGGRWQVSGLDDGQPYQFQVRALAGRRASAWTPETGAVPGSVEKAPLFSMMPSVSPGVLLRLVGSSLTAVLRARLPGRLRR